jgi:hypothetical protein
MVAHVDSVTNPATDARIADGRLYHNAIDDRLGVESS